jgi:hypothetical protein
MKEANTRLVTIAVGNDGVVHGFPTEFTTRKQALLDVAKLGAEGRISLAVTNGDAAMRQQLEALITCDLCRENLVLR